MGDFWIVPLLHSVGDMSESSCYDVRSTGRLQRFVCIMSQEFLETE